MNRTSRPKRKKTVRIEESKKVIKKLNSEILSISTDTVFTHKAWHDQSATIKKIDFPMVADPTGNISRSYGVMIEEEGLTLRGTFIIDPDGNLKTVGDVMLFFLVPGNVKSVP